MTTAQAEKQLKSFLRAAHKAYATDQDPAQNAQPEGVLETLVHSMLSWEATTAKADAALRRLREHFIDFNELRVCMVDEIASGFGSRYPKAAERADRLRVALNDIYKREHAVTLDHLTEMNKRDAREYLDTLQGVPHYAASRTMLLALGAHAAPVDAKILKALVAIGLLEPDTKSPELGATQLERLIRAGDLADAYACIQAWTDDGAPALK